ncbi:UNVERIFIED_CONTAM: Kinesin-like protein KIN-4C [Sesamum radiatum]|uniref:Kinesin-like protein KIN-4C n=1 Tax=Sesamum radiatum TaxID=300843 RepID=A0AAW2QES6_SESRA
MDNSESSQSVRVAVNIRPLVTSELLVGCTDCITVYPAEKQVQIGSHAFTFDNIFGSRGSPCSSIFDECVAPLVDALFHGYNGTVLAYGQTGSGKTYTMGTNYNGEEQKSGVIPKVMDTIFSKVEAMKESTEYLIRVSFIEIFKEEVFDLLDQRTTGATGPARVPIQIRERVSGGITLAGVTEAEVRTKEEMASYLLQGSFARATGSTNMNSQSSRSHAIFTISMEQRRISNNLAGDEVGDDVLHAKLHLVDLAGSERAKRTGADGTRLQEGIHINKGLLALGNVISALGDEKKRKEGGHVPYRDSKLTRILQARIYLLITSNEGHILDSLGGNSKTIMIACVSPADTNAEETLNTLKYANRARNIQNKAIINRDPMTAQMQRMQSQIEQLQAELLYFRGDSNAPSEEIKMLKHKISLLEASRMELQEALQECRISYEHLTQRAIDAQVERDRLIMKIESTQNGKPWDETDTKSDKDFDIVKSYITKIQELESELIRIRNSNRLRRENSDDYLDSEDDGSHSRNLYIMDSDVKTVETDGVVEDVEKELEHSSLQEKLDKELKELDKKLEQKEAEMKRFASVDTSVLKQHYEKKVQDLELEKSALQKEIEALRHNLANISSNTDDSAQKLKEEYLQKLNVLETQVQLQQKIKQESEQFRLWKASREKEVLQLKKEGRRNEYEMHKLLALNQRQKLVLQRKTEEAAMATKRLKELLDSRKASRETPGGGSNKGPGIQALVQTIEHELEVTVGVHEVRSEYERQMKERAKMGEEVARLKEEVLIGKQQNLSEFPQSMSPGARNSRIFALENMLATSSSTLVSMASQLSEAEERERAFSGRGRWNQVRSVAEAKNIMNFLFNLAASSRCQLRDREVDCREKDAEIRDLKEKVVNLVRQVELQKSELSRQENLVKLALERHTKEMKEACGAGAMNNSDGHAYDLRPKGSQNSSVLNSGVYAFELEDMDTSDDDQLEHLRLADDDGDWVRTKERKKRPARRRNSKTDSHVETAVDLEHLVVATSVEQVCCSCSKSSSCKTSRCECRAASGSCTPSCGCGPTKCSNREEVIGKDLLQPEAAGTMLDTDETERSKNLASHGAMLLQTALSEKPVNTNDGGVARKPLSDIGNNLSFSLYLLRQLSLKPRNVDGPEQAKTNGEIDIPLKLPRAMRSTLTSNNQLKERNSDQPNESVNKEVCTPSLGSPRQQARTKNGKENKGL